LAQPFQPRVLSGAVTPEQLETNLKAGELADILKADHTLLDSIMKDCAMESEDYWNDRSQLAWN
jgi:aryl-alcohol dehydrogenase-like predicted oxidoreductase